MFAFPLVNLIFLVILYNIHRKIFYGTACIQIVLYTAGVTYVEQSFDRGDNQFLYYLSLT